MSYPTLCYTIQRQSHHPIKALASYLSVRAPPILFVRRGESDGETDVGHLAERATRRIGPSEISALSRIVSAPLSRQRQQAAGRNECVAAAATRSVVCSALFAWQKYLSGRKRVLVRGCDHLT